MSPSSFRSGNFGLPVRTRPENASTDCWRHGPDRGNAGPGDGRRTCARLQRRSAIRQRPAGGIDIAICRSGLKELSTDRRHWRSTIQGRRISEGDYLKIKLQLLQFQTDLSAARLARAQALVALRQLIGYDGVPADYDVLGDLAYVPLKASLDDLQARACTNGPITTQPPGDNRCPEPDLACQGQCQGGCQWHLRLLPRRGREPGIVVHHFRVADLQSQPG